MLISFRKFYYCSLVLMTTLYPAETAISGPAPLLTPHLAQGVLLIAGENLRDPNFAETVILITHYSETGTSGLILNRRTKIPGPQVMPRLWQLIPLLEHLYIGGPVRTATISLLLKSEYPITDATQVTQGIYLIDTFEQFNNLPVDDIDQGNVRVYSGYVGWGSGQLESELLRGSWHLWHANPELVFSLTPETLWNELIRVVSAKWVSL